MNQDTKQKFVERWEKYFPGAEQPIAFFYAEIPGSVERADTSPKHHCFIADLARVRKGRSLCFENDSVACFGGKRYLGFSQKLRPNFEYFLSCGIAGKLEGERYKKNPEIVKEMMAKQTPFVAPAKYIVFKPWSKLEEGDEPSVVIFFAPPDVLAGLFTLASFDDAGEGVYCPMGAGCSTIVERPLTEAKTSNPRAVLGMFDVSARPCVEPQMLTFAVPIARFLRMIDNMDESFLITDSWQKVRNRFSHGFAR